MAGKRLDEKEKYFTFFHFDELKRRGEDLEKFGEKSCATFCC